VSLLILLYQNAFGWKAKNLLLNVHQPKLKALGLRFNVAKKTVCTRHRLASMETVGL
jgi:hypothetical protein